MTVIAGFFKEGCPILMGDLLLSSSDNLDKEIVFPTIGQISNKHLSKGQYRPTGFCQKINLLSPRLAIAWAGTKIYATTFIREILQANLHNHPTREALLEVFNGIDEGRKELFVVGLYRNGEEMCLFDFNAQKPDPPVSDFDYFKGAGTGFGMLSEVVSKLDAKVTSGQPSMLDKGISSAIQISTALLSQEVLSSLSLINLYGAGYEILHPLRKELAKFTDLTYLFWKTEEEVKGAWRLQPFPFLASKYTYHQDALVIRSVRVSADGTSCKVISDELHVIPPLYKSISGKEFVGYIPSSLNTQYVCNVFLWKNYLGGTGAFATFGRYVASPPPVIWRNEFKDSEGIDINMDFVKSSISKIAAQFTS